MSTQIDETAAENSHAFNFLIVTLALERVQSRGGNRSSKIT
jgi:hypothetical protein